MTPARIRSSALLAISAMLLVGACTSSPNAGRGTAKGPGGGVLTIGMPSGPQSENHNPFLNTSAGAALGYRHMMYEPLAMVNPIRPAEKPKPWLAEKWEWSANYKTLSLTARPGVTWSDGKPFTAEDIAFSFDLVKRHPSLNGSAVPYDSVKVRGDSVVLGFKTPQFVNEANILSLFQVPKHVWQEIEDPATWTNPKPVATGPYTLNRFTPQGVTLKQREGYWKEAPKVGELRYTSYNDNTAATTALANGTLQWSFVSLPNIDKVYTSRDPAHHKAWFPSGLGIHGLWINTERGPFKDRALRRAVNLVVDRQLIHQQGQYGLAPAVESPTGIMLPAGEPFLAPQYKDARLKVDVPAAQRILKEAGYSLRDGALYDPSGERVEITLTDPAGWADYLADLDIIKAGVEKLGIKAAVRTQTVEAWTEAFNNGEFDGTMHWTNGGSTPYDMYKNILDQEQLQATGKPAAGGNQGRFTSAAAGQAITAYASATNDEARAEALGTLQKIMVEEVPMIPTHANALGAEYSTKQWTGWPDETNPYAPPQPTQANSLDVVLHLRAAS
ncbi:ABC transporter substrate-binding protein [Streptomyces sp. SID5770]|uniref:ABC transporter substrate-binding protein n=1 Tax=Streptomyces sp. SID5770 TaxID=2690308 RepID=UPI00136905E3|nr:ABC transporter substrate-binding protein [Streptomyces sp. SID5770]MZE55782.1 ABC transporter substrate-binding protein [Streptomyces sp. SID5770]